ncbi:MAG: hypothetical protein RIR62_2098 [Pseudomonadota bacterium]|jgi:hypothetical protein
MAARRPFSLKPLALAALLATAPVAFGSLSTPPAHAATGLPAPHVSRALDAVLLPVDAAVIAAFGLSPDATGVLVLATQPDGLADRAGVLPGDVLDYVQGNPILTPADLDLIIYNWILEGTVDFVFDGLRAGSVFATETVITLEYWEEVIEITEISSWESYSSESFSYEEFHAEYSEEFATSSEGIVTEESGITEEVTDETVVEEGTDAEGIEAPVAEDAYVDEGGGDEFVDDTGGDAAVDEGGGEEIIEE